MKKETAQPKHSADWPTLLKDNARTGGQGQRPARAPGRALWQYRAGGSARSSPILFDGILFVTSVNGLLHAIDAATGIAKWKFRAEAQVHSTPSLCAERVLFGCDDGKVYAVDRHAGTKVWETDYGRGSLGISCHL